MAVHCSHCPNPRTNFYKRMTNVDKYWCRRCQKFTIVPIHESPVPARVLDRHRIRVQDDRGCNGEPLNGKVGFMCFEHQHKADKFLHALNSDSGYVRLDCHRRYAGVKFVLTDTDVMGRRFKLEHMLKSRVGRFFVYPHAARPDLVNDIYREWAFTTAHFVTTEGHAEIMRLFGYSRPMIPVGWTLCPLRKFKPRKEPVNILFAPIHPRCSEVDQEVNRATFQRLEKLAKAGDIKLTVRFIKSLPDSGLERVEHPNIEYTVGYMDQGYKQIDNADVVIAHQTFLYLAVARGTPAIGMANNMPTHIQLRGKKPVWARNWDKYIGLLRYPYDILDCGNNGEVVSLLQKVVACDEEIAGWRKRMIGSPFDKRRFVEKLERFL